MKFYTKPMAHQIESLRYGIEKKTWGLLSSMGTGKSKVAIDWLVNTEVHTAAILCRKDDIHTWLEELDKHAPTVARVNVVAHKGKKRRIENLRQEIKTRGLTVYLFSHDSVKQLELSIVKMRWDAVVVDEVACIKHHKTKRTKAILRVFGNVPRRVGLTGTPVTNSPMDIFSQMQFIDGGAAFGTSFWKFRNRFFWQSGFEWIPYKNSLEKIRSLMFSRCIRFTKEECLDLPPKVYTKRLFDLTAEQKRRYDLVKKDFELELDKGERVDLIYAVQQFTKMLQITGGFSYRADKSAVEFECSKLDGLRDLLELDEFSAPRKIVIWASFNREIEMIGDLLKKLKRSYVLFYKKTLDEDRVKVRKRFLADPKLQFFVGQVRSGIGMNELAVADTTIYYSRSLRLVDRLQSEDRTHRKGSEKHKSITYIDLISNHTVDSSVFSMLAKARDVASIMTDASALRKLVAP